MWRFPPFRYSTNKYHSVRMYPMFTQRRDRLDLQETNHLQPFKNGALNRNRTCDPPLRRRMLYPTELPGRETHCNI